MAQLFVVQWHYTVYHHIDQTFWTTKRDEFTRTWNRCNEAGGCSFNRHILNDIGLDHEHTVHQMMHKTVIVCEMTLFEVNHFRPALVRARMTWTSGNGSIKYPSKGAWFDQPIKLVQSEALIQWSYDRISILSVIYCRISNNQLVWALYLFRELG